MTSEPTMDLKDYRNYWVDSFHVNIGVGDSTILVLAGFNKITGLKAALRAVLIDGGFASAEERGSIVKLNDMLCRVIPYYYDSKPPVKLDSIIISHWHGDHYSGIVGMISADLQAGMIIKRHNLGGIEKATAEQIDDFVPLDVELEAARCGFMKYDGNDPQTVLYVPYIKGRQGVSNVPSPFHFEIKTSLVNLRVEGLVDFRIGGSSGNRSVPSICKFAAGDLILGDNVFTHNSCKTKGFDSPRSLANHHAREYGLGLCPGLYIVACDKKIIETTAPIIPANFTAMVVDSEGLHETNDTSIICLIIFPDLDSTEGVASTGSKVSHYLAGDASHHLESRVAQWINGKVTAMKLSHHGSASSTPIATFEMFQPRTVVVSASNQHGHPSWQLLLWLCWWNQKKWQEELKAGKFVFQQDQFLWAMLYPYYIGTNGSGQFDVFRNRVEDIRMSGVGLTTFQRSLREIAPQECRRDLDIILSSRQLGEDDIKRWISRQIFDGWEGISSLCRNSTYPGGLRFDTSAPALGNTVPRNEVYYVHIKFEYGEYDGYARGQSRNEPNLYELQIKIKKRLRTVRVVTLSDRTLRSMLKGGKRKQISNANHISDSNSLINNQSTRGGKKRKTGSMTLAAHEDFMQLDMIGENSWPTTPRTLPELPPGYYLCSAAWTMASTPTKDIIVVQKTDKLNDFLLDLQTGVLMLKAAPKFIDGRTSGNTEFTQSDEWADWMIQSLKAFSLEVLWVGPGQVSGFALLLESPWKLRYTTLAISEFFLSSQKNGVPSLGYFDPAGIMIFGLEAPDTTIRCSLKDILDFIGFTDTSLFGLKSSIWLVLDKSPDSRNAVWFWPSNKHETTLRLQFMLEKDDMSTVAHFVAETLKTGLVISDVKVIARKAARKWDLDEGEIMESTSELVLSMVVAYQLQPLFKGYLVFNPDYVTIVVRMFNVRFSDVLAWIVDLVGGDNKKDITDVADWIPGDNDGPEVKQVTIKASLHGILQFSVDLEMSRKFGTEDIAFLLIKVDDIHLAEGGSNEFVGSLWTLPKIDDHARIPPEILPSFEDYLHLQPSKQNLASALPLKSLIPGLDLGDPPAELDLGIYRAIITLSKEEISFTGVIIRDDKKSPETLAFDIERVNLHASYNPKSKKSKVVLETRITLEPSMEGVPAILFASIKHENSLWVLKGSVANLQMGSLFSFFPGGDADVVMEIMEHIELRNLGITYIYTDGLGTSFEISASLIIADFELDMQFNRDTTSWNLDASLEAAAGVKTSIKQILNSVTNNDSIVDMIPPFADFQFSGDEIGSSPGNDATSNSGLSLQVNKSNGFLTFILSLLLKGSGNNPSLRFTLLQIKRISKADEKLPLKRIIRISIESLPFGNTPKIPLIGQFHQPFDEIDYVWVHDPSDKGMTWEEVKCINSIEHEFGGLRFKEMKPEKDLKLDDIILAAGSHFIVVMRDLAQKAPPSVVLDYVFGRPTNLPKDLEHSGNGEIPEEGGKESVSLRLAKSESPESAKGNTSMAKLQTSQGPLSIENFGLRYSDSTLHIIFDTTIKLGPLEFKLLGFGFTLEFSGSINLRSLATARPGVELSGLAVAFDKPPTLIEGIFIKEVTTEVEKYTGGVVLSMAPYSFMAVGSYGEMKETGMKFVFIFGKLNGPLISLEVIDITGISLGFGYNTRLRIPTVAEVDQFPFIGNPNGVAGGGTDPLARLTALTGTGWVTPHEGSFWIAAGLEARVLQCLDVEALVTLQFEPELTLGIVAKAIATVPVMAHPDPSKTFVYAEIGIVATLNVHAGVMRVEAKLSPNSFILDPACHLQGGFALCYWFTGSGHEGDWVFSIGGYHPAYQPPAHYPVPERLSISWILNDHLSVTGEAYFAITPKVCMGGGSLSVVFSMSPLYAYFHAYADFLINYSPFHFLGQVGVSVGVYFTIDCWICTIDIHVDVSASLDLYGPPFGGVVHVDFYVFGFTVHFGDQQSAKDAITLSEFWSLVQQSDKTVKATAATTGVMEKPRSQHTLSVVSGRYAGKTKDMETPEEEPWIVRRGGFKFSIQSQFAIGSAGINDEEPIKHPERIYAKPMHLVTGDDGGQWIESTMRITIREGEVPVSGFKYIPIVKKVPSALWGKYIEGEDPRKAGNSVGSLLTNNDDLTVDLMMGITATAPPPLLSKDSVKPFEVANAMSKEVFVEHEEDEFHPELPVTLLPVVYGPWRPTPLETQSGDPARPWQKAREVWDGTGATDITLKLLVDACTKGFGWTLDLTAATKIPERLVSGLEIEYMLPPFVGVGVTA